MFLVVCEGLCVCSSGRRCLWLHKLSILVDELVSQAVWKRLHVLHKWLLLWGWKYQLKPPGSTFFLKLHRTLLQQGGSRRARPAPAMPAVPAPVWAHPFWLQHPSATSAVVSLHSPVFHSDVTYVHQLKFLVPGWKVWHEKIGLFFD